ncbi:integrase/recombinase XerC [Mesonia hippocampi]|uniref:Integrase/recombinase XerC n=1 Tax=Mesonia hippocampi TaxID=1628250 RepID=A0A840ENP5_9FLAO|nr:tyrosine-type recombinase/integrase [Mesonia hippocampi]MBB4118590.1 integrase/recombinase XerC [Mesonia hippocampi]
MLLTAFLDYLELEKKYSFHTLKAYKKDVEDFLNFLKEKHENTSCLTADYLVVRSWLVELSERNYSNRSINRKVTSLKRYYAFLFHIKEVKVNPLSEHKALKTDMKIYPPFSIKEMEEAIEGVSVVDFKSARARLIIEILYSTGMRRAELISLKIQDVNLETQQIKVKGKGGKYRIIPMLTSLNSILRQYIAFRSELPVIEDRQFLLLTERGKKTYGALLYRTVVTALTGVSSKLKRSPHMLRHTFATHLLNDGADLASVKELMGHASLSSTQVYTHTSISELANIYKNAHPRSEKK